LLQPEIQREKKENKTPLVCEVSRLQRTKALGIKLLS
jgi:hypothetical protein